MAAGDDRLTRLETTVQITAKHQQELMEQRDRELERRLTDFQTGITSLRLLIMRGILWGAGGLLLLVCSLIWKRLGF